jgi:magnesium transporter
MNVRASSSTIGSNDQRRTSATVQTSETVAEHLVTSVASVSRDEPVRAVLERMRRAEPEDVTAIYVTDADGRLLGRVDLPALLGADDRQPIGDLMVEVDVTVGPETGQERAASIAVSHELVALPVVDGERRLLGVVPARTLMAVLRAEHLEDLRRLAGVHREQVMARDAIEEPPLRRVRHRLPWLLVGLAGSALATVVMTGFEATLSTSLAVAFFVPGIVYLADAIGTQTEAAAVRGLSLVHEPLPQLVWGELRAGMFMGTVLAALALPAVWLGFGDPSLAVAVGGALLAAGTVATTIGLLLPWAIARMGRDPAYGSGPLATVIQDVLSIAIYLGIASALVP